MEKSFNLLCLPSVQDIDQVVDKFPFPINLTRGSYRNLEFVFQNRNPKILHNGVDLNHFSFVWLSSSWNCRDLAYAVKLYLKKAKIPFAYVEKNTSKVTDQMIFSLNGIPAPDTLFVDGRSIHRHLLKIKEICGYPLIAKNIRGRGGVLSEYIKTEEDLVKKIKKLSQNEKYLFQRYIPNDYDWGVLVANGVVVSGEKSYPAQGEFRNNACNGAREVFVDLSEIPPEVKEMAIKASRLLKLSWARADIVIDKNTNKPYLMEVNRFPGVTSKTSEVDGGYTFLASHINSLSEKNKQKVLLTASI